MKINSKLILMVGAFSLILAPKVLGYGASSDSVDCEKTIPTTPWIYKAVASGASSVALTWHDVKDVSAWTIAYGTQPGKYIYGLADFGNSSSRSTTINYLPAGTYYFVVRANNDCAIGPFSNEVKVQVSSGRVGTRLVSNNVPANTPVVNPPAKPGKLGTPAVSPSPKAPLANPTSDKPGTPEQPAAKLGFWQRFGSFFRGLFGK